MYFPFFIDKRELVSKERAGGRGCMGGWRSPRSPAKSEQPSVFILNMRAYVRDRLRLRFGAALASPIRTAQPDQIRLE